MRKLLLSFTSMLLLCATLMAQGPAAFKYQAVARNSSGAVMSDKTMNVRIGIYKGISMEYSEVHSVTTNEYGLFSIEVGRGTPETGNFFNVAWGDQPHFMRVEIDPNASGNFMFLGMSELLSVPYARHAETVTNNDDADADPTNEIQDLKLTGSMLRLSLVENPTVVDLMQFNTDNQQMTYESDNFELHLQNGGTVNLSNLKDDADADPTNELQTMTQVGSTVTLSHGGGSINIDDADNDPANELQILTQNGSTITLSHGGGSVVISDNDPENEIQDLSMNNNYLNITNNPNASVIDLNPFMDNTDNQQISFDNQTMELSLQNGGTVDLSDLVDDADSDPTNELQTVTQSGLIVTLSHGGGSFNVADDDNNPMNEIQDIMLVNDELFITLNPLATVIDLAPYKDNTDEQTLNLTGTDLSISNGNTIDLSPFMDNTDAQTITLSGTEISISGGNTIDIVSVNTDNQTLSLSGTDVSISGGNTVDFSVFMDNTDAQTLSVSGTDLSISGGNLVDLSPFMDNTDAQTISLSGTDLSIAGGNTIDIASVNSDNQTLSLSGADVSISGGNTVDFSVFMDNTDSQTLSFSGTDLSISGGNTIDLSSFLDNTDAQTISLSGTDLSISGGNTIDIASVNTDSQTLSLSGTDVSISGGNTVDFSVFMDNTDAQTLSVSNDSLYISNGNGIDLSSYLDNTDNQTLSISGMDLSITDGNTVTIPSSADNLGNHTATQNVAIGTNYISNDGDDEGIRITTTGNVTATGNFFVGETAASNSHVYISGRIFDWDDNAYYVDPDFRSILTDLRVDAGVIVNTGGVTVTAGGVNITAGGMTVSAGGMNVTGNVSLLNNLAVAGDVEVATTSAFYLGDPSTDGSWRIVRETDNLVFERRVAGVWVQKSIMLD